MDTAVPEAGEIQEPAADSIESFCEGLRDLKTAAGNPTLVAISTQVGVSKSVLSDAFSGRKGLPTENTVMRVVGFFGGNQKEWRARRNALAPGATDAAGDGQQAGRFSLRHLIFVAGAAAIVAAFVTGVTMAAVTGANADAAASSRHLSAADNGVDPMLTDCRDDAVIAASEARLDNQVHVQLMYSNECMAVWGRVTRYDNQTDGNTMTMRVWPLDDPQSERAQSRTDIGLQSLYTPMIIEPDTAARICGQATVMVNGKNEELGPKLCI